MTTWLDTKTLAGITGPTGGYFIAPEIFPTVIDTLRESSVLLRSGVRTIRTSKARLTIPRGTSDPGVSWVAEGASLAGSTDPTFGAVTAVPKKVASYLQVSRELIEDSEPDVLAALEAQLLGALGQAIDAAAFASPTVNAEAAPTPLQDVAGVSFLDGSLTGGVDLNAAPFAWIADMTWNYLRYNGDLDHAALYMPARAWARLLKVSEKYWSTSHEPNRAPVLAPHLAGGTGPLRNIWGIPVFVTNLIPGEDPTFPPTPEEGEEVDYRVGEIVSTYLCDTRHLAVVVRDLRVERDTSRHFDADCVGLRAILRADIVALHPATVCHFKGLWVPPGVLYDYPEDVV